MRARVKKVDSEMLGNLESMEKRNEEKSQHSKKWELNEMKCHKQWKVTEINKRNETNILITPDSFRFFNFWFLIQTQEWKNIIFSFICSLFCSLNQQTNFQPFYLCNILNWQITTANGNAFLGNVVEKFHNRRVYSKCGVYDYAP